MGKSDKTPSGQGFGHFKLNEYGTILFGQQMGIKESGFIEIFPEKNIHNVALMFCGKATNKPKADPKEVSDIKWYTIEEALKINLAFAHNDIVRQFASEGKYL